MEELLKEVGCPAEGHIRLRPNCCTVLVSSQTNLRSAISSAEQSTIQISCLQVMVIMLYATGAWRRCFTFHPSFSSGLVIGRPEDLSLDCGCAVTVSWPHLSSCNNKLHESRIDILAPLHQPRTIHDWNLYQGDTDLSWGKPEAPQQRCHLIDSK